MTITHHTFSKTYHLDVLAMRCGLFEFKAAESIVSKHRSQTFNYLLLFDLPHGKIFNVRPERVGSEFVNCHQRLEDLRDPQVLDAAFDSSIPGGEFFRNTVMPLIRDWGAGLEACIRVSSCVRRSRGAELV